MTNLRDYAKGKPCQIRIPGYCTHDPETVVLCHTNLPGISGGSMKATDVCGAWGCNKCHEVVDGRVQTEFSNDEIKRWHAEGILRTLNELVKADVLKW